MAKQNPYVIQRNVILGKLDRKPYHFLLHSRDHRATEVITVYAPTEFDANVYAQSYYNDYFIVELIKLPEDDNDNDN